MLDRSRLLAVVGLAAWVCGAGHGAAAPYVPYPNASGPSLPAAAVESWSLRRLGAAVAAFRGGGFEAARRLLERPGAAPQDRVLLGLYAHAGADVDGAIAALAVGSDPTGLLEDWRLYLLADALAARDRKAEALAALDALVEGHADSPLYVRAYRRRLELAFDSGDWLRTLRDIEVAHQEGLDGALTPLLDELQWRIAEDRGLEAARQATARHILVEHPLTAADLDVVEALRPETGRLDWAKILTPADLVRRARHLLDAGITEGAMVALEAVPAAGRDLDWTLLRAEALTLDRRGGEALGVLDARPPTPQGRLPDLWRGRAAAALEAATVRAGRTNRDAEERQQLREVVWHDLWQLAMRTEGDSRRAALRQLYSMADPETTLETALDVLRRLRDADPSDITGYRDLWKLGWRAFSHDNRTGAIGIWRELQDLYPETSLARQAMYWSGVAHVELGNAERGRDLLRSVAATDTIDFYARHAAARLGAAPRRTPRAAAERWPDDPLLARAALLSELGLDELAKIEVELLRSRSDPRAADGLEGLILARQGDRRASVELVWRAFRGLGKPGQTAVPDLVRQLYYPREYADVVERWATARGLSPTLVYGIIRQESAFDAAAVSHAGARGLMQVMPPTGRELAARLRLPYSTERLVDPEYSVQLGTHYFAQVLAMFDGNVELALAGYNGGPYRVKRWWREAGPGAELDRFIEGLELDETAGYVKRILVFQDSYEQLYAPTG